MNSGKPSAVNCAPSPHTRTVLSSDMLIVMTLRNMYRIEDDLQSQLTHDQ